ncbi:MAG TPA: hypothetical protein VJ959_08465 [Desulfotignum sp.]|nr:hypothetical protein [Desulfotignum sp.]
MIFKNLLGMLILLLNAAGLGFLIYLGILAGIDHFFPRQPEPDPRTSLAKKDPEIINDDIIPQEEDLLKDLDLSDLDKLDLDDFE